MLWLALSALLIALPQLAYSAHSPLKCDRDLVAQSLNSRLKGILDSVQARDPSKRMVFIDLDNTLGYFEPDSGHWILYDGVREALAELSTRAHLVLMTANMRYRAELFVNEHDLGGYFAEVVSSEDFAPHFARISGQHITRQVGHAYFTQLIYQLWVKNPAEVYPDGMAVPKFFGRLSYEEWFEQVYEVYIVPNKWDWVIHYDGILIDDVFAMPKSNENPPVIPIYRRMRNAGMAVFRGRRGGESAGEGPDWKGIVKQVRGLLGI